MSAAAGAWNFGLCATRSREPRQARKGATVSGLPRVPQITRSSSRRKEVHLGPFACAQGKQLKVEGELRSAGFDGATMILAGVVLTLFGLGCVGVVFFVLWLNKQSRSAKSTDAK
jgi:hypothetical protein